jgi:ligand-binding sensor domain-containing protein
VKKTNGTWQAFSLSPYIVDDFISDVVIDQFNQKWIIVPRGKGILVYNDNNTLDNPFDDRIKLLNTNPNNGGLHDAHILSLAVDRNGQVWVGTIKGVAVFYSPENVFSADVNIEAQQIYVEEEGISQYLLESEEVSCIAVDGANNKWFGTNNSGVFYMSEDGTKQIYHFTEENSPLLSNNIFDISIDNESGEVFFGTEKGIVSFRNVATKASETSEKAKVFPNPVKESYNGPIAIKNLTEDANVKITDISSNVVFEGFAEGGQIIWNGTNLNGDRVSTGVYLVFITNEDGSQTMVSKILFAR